jgi:hypothetical protein
LNSPERHGNPDFVVKREAVAFRKQNDPLRGLDVPRLNSVHVSTLAANRRASAFHVLNLSIGRRTDRLTAADNATGAEV